MVKSGLYAAMDGKYGEKNIRIIADGVQEMEQEIKYINSVFHMIQREESI